MTALTAHEKSPMGPGAVDVKYENKMFRDDPTLKDRFYVKPDPVAPIPPVSGPNSVAAKVQPPSRVVKNMNRLRHDEMASWSGIAALRNLVDDTMPEDQQAVLDAGAAEAIIATMEAWPDHAGIQVSGCGTLVKVAEVDSNARMRVLQAGALFEIAAAVDRLSKAHHKDTDGDKIGKEIVHKANFARDCLLKIAGKKTDPRNKKHIQAAIDGGVDVKLFSKLGLKEREKMEEDARKRWLQLKAIREEEEDKKEAELLNKTPWAYTMDRDRSTCVLFPGQGAQKKGMADKLMSCAPAKALFDKAAEILGYDLAALIRDGPQEKLDQTLYAQPAVFVTGLAAVEKAKLEQFETLGRTKTTAGFSLGEYSALVYANVMTFEDGLRLVKARAEAMDAAAKMGATCMASISGVDDRSCPLQRHWRVLSGCGPCARAAQATDRRAGALGAADGRCDGRLPQPCGLPRDGPRQAAQGHDASDQPGGVGQDERARVREPFGCSSSRAAAGGARRPRPVPPHTTIHRPKVARVSKLAPWRLATSAPHN